MQNSYKKNYLKIYFWQGISLVMNFLSMFIVVPYLTSEPTIYGIYSICISISIFLVYADLGFLGAGQKYAAEDFARNETKNEINVVGFTLCILILFLLLISIVFIFFSFYPEFLIKGLLPGNHKTIASSLLLILALSTPVTLLQRASQLIFGVRLEEYFIQRTNIICSLLKIVSVLWFFRNGTYNIVGYFLFSQIINLFGAIINLIIARIRYNYDFILLLRSIRFNKIIFKKTKNLAFTSFYLTICWILYYELDPTIIGKFIGPEQVAYYAIGLTILSFFRSVLGILFSPFNARFNHFVGLNDNIGLKSLYFRIIKLFAPLIVIPLITIYLLSSPIILSWVGSDYVFSLEIAKYLILCNLFAFITYPTNTLLISKEKIKDLIRINTLIPLIYWGGIVLCYSFLGLKAFAVFKLIAFSFSALFYHRIMTRFLQINFMQSLKEFFSPLVVPILFLFLIYNLIIDYLPDEKSKINLLLMGIIALGMITFAFLIQYFVSPKIRDELKSLIFSFINQKHL